jgi:hypothetical protein
MTHFLTEFPVGNTPPCSKSSCHSSQASELARVDEPRTLCHAEPTSFSIGRLICDFRSGCALIFDAFPDKAAIAQLHISSTPHLAEALFQGGLITNGQAAIDMALAMQEARTSPLPGCSCLRGQNSQPPK